MLALTTLARSFDPERQILAASRFTVCGGRLGIVSTDGRRLAVAGNSTQDDAFTLERGCADTLSSLASFADGDVLIKIEGKSVVFEGNGFALSCQPVEARYPNFAACIPGKEKLPYSVSINRKALGLAVAQSMGACEDDFECLGLKFSRDSLIVSSIQNDRDFSKSLAIEYSGPAVEINLNSRFLLAPLEKMSCEVLTLEINDEESPVVLSADDYLYVLMPVKPSA